MAKVNAVTTATAVNQEGPLVGNYDPVTGVVTVSHGAPVPIYDVNTQPQSLSGLLDGEIFGVPKKLIAIGLIAYLLTRGK